MKHEVKIPVGCKATVFVEDKRIVIVVDPIQKQTIEKGEPCDPFSIWKQRVHEQVIQRDETQSGVDKSVRIIAETKEDIPVAGPKSFELSQENLCKLAGVEGGVIRGAIYLDKLADSDKKDLESIDLRRHITLPEVDAIKIGCGESPFPLYFSFVTSGRGDIAISNGEVYPVILTCNGEIQLNQTCNFSFIRNSTIEEEQNLIEALRVQRSLMWDGEKLINWVPRMGETYLAFDFDCTQMALEYSGKKVDVLLAEAGNVFPVEFLTEERQTQFKKTIMDLFDSWRQ